MEEYTDNQVTERQELNLDLAGISHLKETRGWTQFLSILGFIFLGFMLIFGLAGGTFMNKMGPTEQIGSGLFIAMIIIMIVVYFFPIYFLFNFSRFSKTAIETKDPISFTEAMRYLKLHYRYMGILTIIMVSIYALALILGIMASSFTGIF